MSNDDPIPPARPAGSDQRFNKDAAEEILRRAADEQARLDVERDHAYSLEQLQEIAAEAGISPEAVRAAAEAHQSSDLAPAAAPHTAASWLPATWSPRARRAAVAAAGVAIIGVLVAMVGVGPVAVTLGAVTLVLVLLISLLGVGV